VTDTDQEGLVDKSSESPDSPCLTSSTSPDGGTNHKEQINTSEQVTTAEGKSDISTPDYLRDFNALYSDISPGNSATISPVDTGRDEIMESNTSTNQEDIGQQDAGIDHLRLSDDISVLLEDSAAGDRVNTEERGNADEGNPEQIKTHQEGTPVLTVEAFNDIVRGGRSKSPILIDDTDHQDFFQVKERRFAQCMERFDNGNGTYTISQPIAMAVVLALDTEQRNRNYIHAMNEFQVSQIKETSDFTKRITEEVTRNMSQHIIQKLDGPLKESKKQIEDRAKIIIGRLDEDDRVLEAHKEHRLARGFLSRTREEREVELYEARITALSEDNESLQAQLSELTRTYNASKDQIVKLQEGRTKWQQKCLTMMAKRPREENVGPGSAKRAAENRPDPEPATSEDITMSPTEVIPSSVGPSHTSNTSDNSNTSNTIHTSNTSSSKLPPPPWGAPLPVEINDRRKEKFKRDYDLDFDPWGPGLTIEDEAEVTLKMWKAQVRKGSTYVPDYHESKLQKYSITHEGNIKVGVKAKEDFNRSTVSFTYFQRVEERHEGYIMFQRRNYIPRTVTNYWRILNDPPLAALERCVPVSLSGEKFRTFPNIA
jgi:hypothetical protein